MGDRLPDSQIAAEPALHQHRLVPGGYWFQSRPGVHVVHDVATNCPVGGALDQWYAGAAPAWVSCFFGDGVDLVGDQAVGLAVDGGCGAGVGGVD